MVRFHLQSWWSLRGLDACFGACIVYLSYSLLALSFCGSKLMGCY